MILTKKDREKKRREKEKNKLKTIRQKIDDAKGLLTDKEVFCSLAMNEYLKNKINKVLLENRIPAVLVRIIWAPSNNAFVAATDNQRIELNAANELLDGSRQERLEKLCGLAAHELSHICFTCFTEQTAHVIAMGNGKLYPATPTVDEEYSENLNMLIDFLEGKRGLIDKENPAFANRNALISVSRSISNILEDPRVENLFSQYCFHHRTLYSGLLKMLKRQQLCCQPLSVIIDKLKEGELLSFEAMEQVMLHFGRFGEIKGYSYKAHKNEPFIKSFMKIKDFCLDYIDSISSVETLTALNMILIALFPEIEEYILEVDKRQKAMKDLAKDIGDAIKERNNSLEGTTPSPLPGTTGNGLNPNKVAKKSPSSSKTQEDNASLEEDSPSMGENSPASAKETGEPLPEESSEDLGDGTASCNASTSEINIDEERATEGVARDTSCYQKTNQIINDLERYGEEEHVSKKQEATNTKVDLDSITNAIAKERTTAQMEKEIEKDLNEFAADIDFGTIHNGISSQIIRHVVTDQNRNDYNNIAPGLIKIASLMARKADYFMEDDSPIEIRGRFSGKSFKAASVVKGNYKYFARDYNLEPAPKIAIAVRVDESGSMSGARAAAAKATALLIYTFCHMVGVKVAIYGDDTDGKVNLYCYTDFDTYDIEDDKYRLCNISAGGCNRDGFAIRYLKERLAEQDADKKLMIIISDGQPADENYYGTAALADIQTICKECDREGIGYIAAAIGSDKEDIKAIYGERHFLDISDLSSLPEKLTNLIKRLLK